MKTISIYGGHDANLTFADSVSGKYHVIELERITKERFYKLQTQPVEDIIYMLKYCQQIAEKFWGFKNDYDCLISGVDGFIDYRILGQAFNFKTINQHDHHHSHAASTFYQSGFEESIVISYDGGGNDGFFNVYIADESGIKLIDKIDCDFGGCYLLLASCIKEITLSSRSQLALAGKLMGLCAYGSVMQDKVKPMSEFYIDRNYKKLSNSTGLNLNNVDRPWGDGSQTGPFENAIFESQSAYDFAATAQMAYEDKFIEIFENYLERYPNFKNVCITGGGGLNVLLNQRIKNNYDINLFVAPNPNDCGLSLGQTFLCQKPNTNKVNITYNGLPILDINRKNELLSERKTKELDLDYVCNLLKQGKIIGVCMNDSEVGPRALGNRSIICDPSHKDMKDILNSKVKFREWFRPFAPFCLKSDADKYFISKDFEDFEFMGFAPIVKEEFRHKIPSITHVDGSARLQTVSESSHNFFFNLLNKFSNYSDVNVLLNTSFNIKGNPILSTIEDALFVLDNTELDCLIIEDKIIEK